MLTRFLAWPKVIGYALAIASIAASGCGSDSLSNHTGLVVPKAERWPGGIIPVCWRTPGFSSERKFIRLTIEREYNSKTSVRFIGWKECTGKSPRGYVAVSIVPGTRAASATEGYSPNGNKATFSDFAFSHPKKKRCRASKKMAKACMNNAVLHEFGHAAGLIHEQERGDSRCDNHLGFPHSTGEIPIGAYDSQSVMDACNPKYHSQMISLSKGDIAAINHMY